LEKVAVLNFCFPYISEEKEWDQNVHVFLAREWEGTPFETEEMRPEWFNEKEIPYDKMWDDDKLWLPEILEGKKLKADFIFKEGEIILEHNINITEKL